MAQDNRELAVGLQLDEEGVLLTWFRPGMAEPKTEDLPAERERMDRKVWDAACGRGEPMELLVHYLTARLETVLGDIDRKRVRIMITVPTLEPLLAQRLPQVMEIMGFVRRNVYLQDYLSGFYYYTINQRRELWNGDVALLECVNDCMIGHVLHTDWSTSPALVTIEKAGTQRVDEKARDGRDDAAWDQERDRLFFEFLKKVFERRSVITCFLMGSYFSKEWAQKSFQYLCTRRHAFQGENLFSRGACYGAMERCGMVRSQNLLYLGNDIIRDNLGMYLRIRGREMYYPLVSAGINWFEAHHECEMVPDGEKEVTIWTKPMSGGTEVAHILRLDDFPDRPNRASRLKLTMYFTAPDCCCLEVEDLGFGGFFRPSGRQWKRKIYL